MKLPEKNWRQNTLKWAGDAQGIAFIGYALIAIGLSASRAMISTGTGLLILSAILAVIKDPGSAGRKISFYTVITLFLFLLPLLSGLYSGDIQRWAELIRVKLPLLLIPLAASQLAPPNIRQLKWIVLTFSVCQSVVAISSFVYYIIMYDSPFGVMAEHIKVFGTIDIITKIHHIYFGLFLAFSSVWSFILFMEKMQPLLVKRESVLFLILAILNAILIHLLTSRTGFIVLYSGYFACSVYFILSNKRYKEGILLAILFFSAPFIFYKTVPSFKNRIDFTIWESKEYLVYHKLWDSSMMKRYFTWEITWDIFKSQPVTGIGIGDMREALKKEGKIRLQNMNKAEDMTEAELLESPHCQYLENLAALGIPGFISLILAGIFPFFVRRKPVWIYIFGFVFLLSMLTESLLERQWGVTFFLMITALSGLYTKKEPD